MTAVNSGDVATIVAALVAGLLGLVPWWLERGRRSRLENEIRRRTWSDISKIRGLMLDLEKDHEAGLGGANALQAEGKLTIMLRDLLREACNNEPELSLATVRKWRASGKLGSDWQQELVLVLLHADEMSDAELKALGSRYGDIDELPDGHAMKARP
jgi:hypothetical protein